MQQKELSERSPLRVLDQSIHGGLGRGNIGVVVARHGVGKTAFLVGIALDELMRGRNVLHVSLEQTAERVRTYYDEIFAALSHAQALDDVWRVRLSLERQRRIHCYLGGTFSLERLRESLAFMKHNGDFTPQSVVIDGYEFSARSGPELAGLRAIARELDAELWMSSVTSRAAQRDERGVPEPLTRLWDAVDVILGMAHDGKAVHIGLLKDHGNPDVSELKLALDPTTLLLFRE